MADQKPTSEYLLSPYRVLDLTDARGLLCGKMLADLGADVIQVEPPQGNSARRLGPFSNDDVRPESSLFWWAYAANKRSITLDIETVDGCNLLRGLAKQADFLMESFPPGYLADLGLAFSDLQKLNPALVMVSITAFGQNGPYANYQATDIVGMALGGFMSLTGDSDRAPLRLGFPHFYLHGSAAGAAGAMLAHAHRALTGEGQHVDVSCQQAVAKTLAHAPQSWDIEGVIIKRMGVFRQTSADTKVRVNWRCKDGYINYMLQGGSVAASTRALLAWLDEEGMGDDYLNEINWEELGYGLVRTEVMERIVEPLQKFFESKTKDELTQGSVDRRILLFPVATPRDLLEHPQLEARKYFRQLEQSGQGTTVTHPGAFVSAMGTAHVGPSRRPPLIGEHNSQIYGEELGLSRDDLSVLKQGGVI